MDRFATGMMVRHSTLGIGRVIAVETAAVHVFFAEGERRAAAKLRLPAASAFLKAEPKGHDERLENLPDFALDPETGRYAPHQPRPAGARRARK
ncbi:MAG TPA: hypothetical protein VMS64_24110 [Candidatus Methylomirabilis sp.]|nr:hypothetical protein [Candidatus Methylomirabilis sp.]